MSFIIQELCWSWSSFLTQARDARKSPEQAGTVHVSGLEISVGFRKNRSSWAAVREKLSRRKHWEPLNTALSCLMREEGCRTWSQRPRNIYYTPESHQPSCTVCAEWISAVRKQGSSQIWKLQPVTQLHSRKGELVKTSSAATETWILTGNGWLLWSSATGVGVGNS